MLVCYISGDQIAGLSVGVRSEWLARVKPQLPGVFSGDDVLGRQVRGETLENAESEVSGIAVPKFAIPAMAISCVGLPAILRTGALASASIGPARI